MSVYGEAAAFQAGVLGLRVDRPPATLPATTAGALFTIVGRVAVTQIVGEVTTIIQTQANATKLTANPTVGTAADICATLDITADEVGTLYSITGTAATAMTGVSAGGVAGMAVQVVLQPGTLDLDCAATSTGAVRWTIFYVPLDEGASIVAA